MNVQHEQLQARYSIELNNMNFHIAAYRNETARNWYKASKIGDLSLGAIIDSANGGDDSATALLRGEAEGEVNIKHNNRAYLAQGVEFTLEWEFESGNLNHNIETGVRLHQDEEDRRIHEHW